MIDINMKIGDKYKMIGSNRQVTVTGVGNIKVYYLFDDAVVEDSLPIGDFQMWFEPVANTPLPAGTYCDCGGAVTYNSMEAVYHSYWCISQKESL